MGCYARVVAVATVMVVSAVGGAQPAAEAQPPAAQGTPPPATPTAAQPPRPRLVFAGPARKGRVPLSLRPDGQRRGTLSLVLRNRSAARGQLRLRFFPRSGFPVTLVGPAGGRRGGRFVEVLHPRRQRVPLPPRSSRGLHLAFAVGRHEPPVRVDGMLVADLVDRRGTGPRPAAARLRVRRIPPPVRFAPREVTMHVISYCWLVADWLGADCGRRASVVLRGPRIRALIDEAKADGALGHAVLGNGDGARAVVRIEGPQAVGRGVEATVAADDVAGVGEFEGSIPLLPGGRGRAALPIELTVGHSLLLAVLTVFAGTLLGGLLDRRSRVRRDRLLLGLRVERALADYDDELGRSGGRPRSYDIRELIEPRVTRWSRLQPFPSKHGGVSALMWRIGAARDKRDFEEVAAEVERFVERVDRWVRIERVAGEAKAILDRKVSPRRSSSFADCGAYRRLDRLYEQLRSEPATDDVARERRHAVLTQMEIVTRWEALWALHRALETKDDWNADDRDTIERHDYPALDRLAKRLRGSGAKGEATLRSELSHATHKLGALVERERLEAPPEVVALEHRAEGIEADMKTPPSRPVPVHRSLGARALSGVRWRDWAWTLGRALVAVTAYTLTIYDDTWGTAIDYATAFTAGFLTETIVDWAIMPAFRSFQTWRKGDEAVAAETA